jgi:tetratricopeptide (TPR) repeat protein
MRGVVGCVIAIALLVASTGHAEDKDAARKAYLEGQKYYNLAQYADALEAFKRAYWNYEEPTFLFNIAQCHRALKHQSEAVEFYRSYLRNAPDAPNRVEVQRIIGELESAIAQERALSTAPPEGTLADASKPLPPNAVVTTAPPPPASLWMITCSKCFVALRSPPMAKPPSKPELR